MFPEVKAVSCGAILSNYQRFRVENVCMRLGLIPLHYLWQRDRDSLLGEMIDCGLHAILLKVSGGGLEPNRHIGRDLATLRPAFEKLRDRFGLDICGEGGEYESLVLDCPLFYRRINLTKTRLVVDGGDPSVGHLAVDAFETVPKERSEWPLQRPFPLPTAILSITNLVSQADVYLPSVAAEITVGLDGLAATNLLMPPAASLPPVGENRGIDGCLLRQLKS